MVKKMSVGIEPLGKMVLLELEEAAEKTDSGFLLPEAAREKMNVGLVAGVGPDAEHVKAGDRVLFGKWSGTEIKLDGEDLLIMKESDIMGIMG